MTDSARRRRTSPGAIIGSIAGGLGVGIALTFGGLILINGQIPLPLPTPTPTPTVTPQILPSEAWAQATATALPVSVTPPATKLVLGDAGQVELALGKGLSALISLTAGTPVPASDADLKVLRKVTPQLTGMSVFYLPITVTKVAGSPLSGVMLGPVIFGVTRDGVVVQQLTIVDWRACRGGPLSAAIDQSGTAVTLCFAAATAAEAPAVAGIVFSQAGGPYDVAKGTAISWLPKG